MRAKKPRNGGFSASGGLGETVFAQGDVPSFAAGDVPSSPAAGMILRHRLLAISAGLPLCVDNCLQRRRLDVHHPPPRRWSRAPVILRASQAFRVFRPVIASWRLRHVENFADHTPVPIGRLALNSWPHLPGLVEKLPLGGRWTKGVAMSKASSSSSPPRLGDFAK